MAKKTKAAARAEGLKDFTGPDPEKQAIETLAKAAAEKNKKRAGSNGDGPSDEVYLRNLTLIAADQVALDKLKEAVAEQVAVLRNRYKTSKDDGCDNDAIRLYLKIKKRPAGEIVSEHRSLGRILRLMEDPLGTQWQLFSIPADVEAAKEGVVPMEAELQGQHAYSNGEPLENNPFGSEPGSQNYVDWRQGWVNAQNAKARSMGPSNGAIRTSEGGGQLA